MKTQIYENIVKTQIYETPNSNEAKIKKKLKTFYTEPVRFIEEKNNLRHSQKF